MHDFILASISGEDPLVGNGSLGPVRQALHASFPPDRSQVHCSACEQVVTGLTIAEAAEDFDTDLQDIGLLLRKDEIHVIGRDPTSMSICRNSIEWCFESKQARLLDWDLEISGGTSFVTVRK